MIALRQRKMAAVLFDEAHGESFSIRPETAAAMRPQHPAAASLAAAAGALDERDFVVTARPEGPIDGQALNGVDVVVIAHPSEPAWESTVGGSPRLSSAELDALAAFVNDGGGLVVLAENESAKYGDNLGDLLERFGLRLQSLVVRDRRRNHGAPSWVLAEADPAAAAPALLHLVDDVCFYRAGAIQSDVSGAMVLRAAASAEPAGAGLLAAVPHGAGRVVLVADADLFGDDFLSEFDHLQLWLNLLYWVAAPAFRRAPDPVQSTSAQDPAWLRLKEATDALRRLQDPSGAVDLERHAVGEVRRHVEEMREALASLAPRFPHEQDYLEQVRTDLDAWVAAGCGKPDFQESLARFRPERERRDGVEHLVVFPMYTPNGSPDTRFEALLTLTPWPEFVDLLERSEYDNDKFVPVQLVDNTAGYDSECAVLFPETVSLAGRPSNNFGGIFCDRESSRFRRTVERAADVLHLDLPPDVAALVASADLARDTYIMWDMIHDRWHSHGDLPFDPFMIRQRLPYWMYSLEELRVDLATFGDAGRLVRDGFPFARYVQYAILFDRIIRFPITGERVRNYDGLGGQLLFGFLHVRGVVRWSDNRLAIDWRQLEEAVAALRAEVDGLYRSGISSSRVTYWAAAHDLVSRYVPPNVASQWRSDRRVVSDEADARAWIDRVLDDEFPLSTFYLSLRKKMTEEPAGV